MADVRPFSAFVPKEGMARKVATLPYDVVNRAEAAALAEGNPVSFLRVTRSEIELPESVHPYSPEVYAKAADNWRKIKDMALRKMPSGFFVYSLVMDGRRQTGIVAAASVADYQAGIVRKHERTRQDKEDDRTRHISTLRAQTGPVFLTYRESAPLDSIVAETTQEVPLFDFTAEDGIHHTGWCISASRTEDVAAAFRDIPILYIADGHHRAASACRTETMLKEEGKPVGEADRFLAVIFPASQLKILAYNRIVMDLNGLDDDAFMKKLHEVCTVSETDSPVPSAPGFVHAYFQKRWLKLDFTAYSPEDVIDRLDVSLLQNNLLKPVLGIDDPRTSKRIDFVGGIRGTDELTKLVDNGAAKIAFSMYPTSLEQLMDVADENKIMPPKSTWFEPKLRDGLFVHEI